LNRWRPSPSLVVSFVALFVALAGTAIALNTNSVGAKHIKADAVRADEIKADAVRSDEIQTQAVGTDEIALLSVGAEDIGLDEVGQIHVAPNAVASEEIANGAVDSPEIGEGGAHGGIHPHDGNEVTIAGQTGQNGAYVLGTATATCAAGEELVSGYAHWGGDPDGTDEELVIVEYEPDYVNEVWVAVGGNDSGTDALFESVAVCLEA
jgi:hypothetical protein